MSIESKNMLGAVMVATAFFMFWSFVVPEYQKISKFNTGIEERNKTLEERKAILENIRSLGTEYNKRSGEIKTFSALVPTNKEISELIAALDAIAKESGVLLSEMSISPPTRAEAGALTNVSITGTLSGTYTGLFAFLSNIEKSSRIINIKNISFGPEEGSASSILNIGFIGEAFFVK